MDWKSLLKAVLALVLPTIFNEVILPKVPDIPLDAAQFAELIIYGIGFLVGGWQIQNFFKGGPR